VTTRVRLKSGEIHHSLSQRRNDAVTPGSAVVSTAFFGVSPKTSVPGETPPNGERAAGVWLAGGTPVRATETVALPISNESFRQRERIIQPGVAAILREATPGHARFLPLPGTGCGMLHIRAGGRSAATPRNNEVRRSRFIYACL
jgi:hypothetical protein